MAIERAYITESPAALQLFSEMERNREDAARRWQHFREVISPAILEVSKGQPTRVIGQRSGAPLPQWDSAVRALPRFDMASHQRRMGIPPLIVTERILEPRVRVDRDKDGAPTAIYQLWEEADVDEHVQAHTVDSVDWYALPLSAWRRREAARLMRASRR